MADQYLHPDQLCVGIFVQLELGWMDHPFAFSSFRIKDEHQIAVIKRLGLTRIKYDPARSSTKPGLSDRSAAAIPAVEDTVVSQGLAEKTRRIEQLAQIRKDIERVEQQFIKVTDSIRNITRSLRSNPEMAVHESNEVVKQLVDTMMQGDSVTLHAISEKLGEDAYFHSLNVSVLSLMLGKAYGLDVEALQQVGLGAMLHDIGKVEIPTIVTLKTEPLTRPEQVLLEQHCDYGIRLAQKAPVSQMVRDVIQQHHECVDGSGYPKKLRGEQIILAARLVSITNAYDNLCNPVNIATAVTPAEALSQLYALKRAKFDDHLLKLFIKRMGIYPPGSIVQLSNDMIGLVVAVNSEQPLRPNIMVYDPTVPKEQALIVNLETEPELKVGKNLRPAQLPRQVHQYLNPRKNVTYFFDPKQKERA